MDRSTVAIRVNHNTPPSPRPMDVAKALAAAVSADDVDGIAKLLRELVEEEACHAPSRNLKMAVFKVRSFAGPAGELAKVLLGRWKKGAGGAGRAAAPKSKRATGAQKKRLKAIGGQYVHYNPLLLTKLVQITPAPSGR